MTAVRLALVVMAAGTSCGKAASYDGAIYRRGPVHFAHGVLPAGWKPATVEGLAVAFYHDRFGATAGVATVCEGIRDAGLESLARQELVGLERRSVLEEGRISVDGREAVDWVVKGSVDGVDVRVNLVVLRKGPCVYDLNLVCRPSTFEEARADFRAFVAGFRVLED